VIFFSIACTPGWPDEKSAIAINNADFILVVFSCEYNCWFLNWLFFFDRLSSSAFTTLYTVTHIVLLYRSPSIDATRTIWVLTHTSAHVLGYIILLSVLLKVISTFASIKSFCLTPRSIWTVNSLRHLMHYTIYFSHVIRRKSLYQLFGCTHGRTVVDVLSYTHSRETQRAHIRKRISHKRTISDCSPFGSDWFSGCKVFRRKSI